MGLPQSGSFLFRSGGGDSGSVASSQNSSYEITNLGLSVSVAANALTVALKGKDGNDPSALNEVAIGFRSSTLTSGVYTQRTVDAALSVTVSSGSTLGTTSGVASYIYVYAIDNSGVVELAIINGLRDEGALQSTTAEGGAGAADSVNVLYSTTARTDKPVRLIGRILISEATAGTWASAPTAVSVVPFDQIYGPTIQSFTSGSGTYTTPTNVKRIRVRMVGGGGGGGGSATSSPGGTGGNGGNTTFGSSLLVANGGGGGPGGNAGGAGGTASLGTGPVGIARTGATGGGASAVTGTGFVATGGMGGVSPFGGAGPGNYTGAGIAAVANTGSGGGGAGINNALLSLSGSGGGAGGYVDAIIVSPGASYAYAVGAAGTAGAAGTNGTAGGAGGSGYIIVEEFY